LGIGFIFKVYRAVGTRRILCTRTWSGGCLGARAQIANAHTSKYLLSEGSNVWNSGSGCSVQRGSTHGARVRIVATSGTHSWYAQLAYTAGMYNWHVQLARAAGTYGWRAQLARIFSRTGTWLGHNTRPDTHTFQSTHLAGCLRAAMFRQLARLLMDTRRAEAPAVHSL